MSIIVRINAYNNTIKYANRLYASIPENYYWVALVCFIIVTIIFVARLGLKTGLKWGCGVLLAEYVYLLFCSTVFFRRNNALVGFNCIPFKTYKEIITGRDFLFSQTIMNVLVFIPIGLLLRIIENKWYVALSMGFLISLCVEMLQYFLAKGYCEIDDVIHNTLGCLLGFGLYGLGKRCYLLLR
jgi:glycopeptide antibiotics resistance protein